MYLRILREVFMYVNKGRKILKSFLNKLEQDRQTAHYEVLKILLKLQ